jgi:hypothetical protein
MTVHASSALRIVETAARDGREHAIRLLDELNAPAVTSGSRWQKSSPHAGYPSRRWEQLPEAPLGLRTRIRPP